MKPNRHTVARVACPIVAALALVDPTPGAAAVDCGPVIAAYEKAEATKRYAVYEVDRIDQAPKGQPFSVTVDGASWVQAYSADGRANGYQRTGRLAAGESAALQAREKSGRARCTSLAARKVGSVEATGFRIDHGGTGQDPTAIDFYVDPGTGLPVWHGMGSDHGGMRWAYGSAVVLPPAARPTR